MKKLKAMMALLLAMVMVLSMSVVAFAEDGETPSTETPAETTYTITITKDSTDKVGHTYGAYQLFKGDLAEKEIEGGTKTKTLSNIQWGESINREKVAQLINNLNAIDGLNVAEGSDAAAVAKAISDAGFGYDSTGAQAVADAFAKALGNPEKTQGTANEQGEYVLTVPAGYYLVKDTAAVSGEGAQTRYILEVVSNVKPAEKASVPSVVKKVKEKDDGKAESDTNPTDWQDAADYDIGDSIPYKLEGTLPSKFAEYDTYKVYTFIDTLSNGLTPPEANAVTVKVGDKDVSSHFDITINGQVLTISLKKGEDLRKWTDPSLTQDSTFVVNYTATLNNNAKIGSEGNPNTVKLEFTNNPNGEQDGEKGTTPEDKVIVFTYEIQALKVEPTSDAAIEQTEYENLTDEQKKNYVKVGDKWQKTTPLSGAGFTLYKKVNGSYVAVGEELKGVTTFEFKGIDAGEYKLVETTVPGGYNKAADVEITVTATYETDSVDPKLTSLTVSPENAGFVVESTTTTTTGEGSEAAATTSYSGNIVGHILNQKGSSLPETGGMGTRLFYILGACLVIGAGMFLVIRRRLSAE